MVVRWDIRWRPRRYTMLGGDRSGCPLAPCRLLVILGPVQLVGWCRVGNGQCCSQMCLRIKSEVAGWQVPRLSPTTDWLRYCYRVRKYITDLSNTRTPFALQTIFSLFECISCFCFLSAIHVKVSSSEINWSTSVHSLRSSDTKFGAPEHTTCSRG